MYLILGFLLNLNLSKNDFFSPPIEVGELMKNCDGTDVAVSPQPMLLLVPELPESIKPFSNSC